MSDRCPHGARVNCPTAGDTTPAWRNGPFEVRRSTAVDGACELTVVLDGVEGLPMRCQRESPDPLLGQLHMGGKA